MTQPVLIEVSEPDADRVRIDQLSWQLLRDLRRLGLGVERQSARPPTGIATLLVNVTAASAFGVLVNGIFGWLGPRQCQIKISRGESSIALSAATRTERERLVDWLLVGK